MSLISMACSWCTTIIRRTSRRPRSARRPRTRRKAVVPCRGSNAPPGCSVPARSSRQGQYCRRPRALRVRGWTREISCVLSMARKSRRLAGCGQGISAAAAGATGHHVRLIPGRSGSARAARSTPRAAARLATEDPRTSMLRGGGVAEKWMNASTHPAAAARALLIAVVQASAFGWSTRCYRPWRRALNPAQVPPRAHGRSGGVTALCWRHARCRVHPGIKSSRQSAATRETRHAATGQHRADVLRRLVLYSSSPNPATESVNGLRTWLKLQCAWCSRILVAEGEFPVTGYRNSGQVTACPCFIRHRA